MIDLIHELDVHADLAADDIGSGPVGHRIIVNIVRGHVTGARLNGSVVGASADWFLLGSDGFGRVDVRSTIRTDDGAHVYAQYRGLLELTPAVQSILNGGDAPTDYGDQYFFTTPRFETGDERYSVAEHDAVRRRGPSSPRPRRRVPLLQGRPLALTSRFRRSPPTEENRSPSRREARRLT